MIWVMLTLWTVPAAHAAEVASHIRVLAASCAACHGMDGNSVGGTPVLAGLDRTHFILQMQEFGSGKRSSTVMLHHAKGLTADETEQLADFFRAQQRLPVASLKPFGQ